MNQTDLIAKLEQIRLIAEEALGETGARNRKYPGKGRPDAGNHTVSTRSALPKWILALREQNFFAQPRTAAEVHDRLKKRYHCELNRVAVALLRLQRRKQLRKAACVRNGKKQTAYVW